MTDVAKIMKGLHEAECLLEDRVPARYRGNALQAVKDAQEILKARKEGRWEEYNPQDSDLCRIIRCSVCQHGSIVGYNVSYGMWIMKKNFCPECGADLRDGRVIGC